MMNSLTPRRLNFRLSARQRTLIAIVLVLLIVLGVSYGFFLEKRERVLRHLSARRVVTGRVEIPKWIARYGLDGYLPQRMFNQIDDVFIESDEDLIDLLAVNDLESARSLHLHTPAVTGRSLQELSDLNSLRMFSIDEVPVTGEVWVHLPGMPQLEIVELKNTSLPDKGVSRLLEATTLWVIVLNNVDVSESSLVRLIRKPGLKELSLTQVPVTDAIINAIIETKTLESIYVGETSGTKLSAEKFRDLCDRPDLVSLGLRLECDRLDISLFTEHPELKELYLPKFVCRNVDVPVLTRLPRLTRLEINAGEIVPEDIAALTDVQRLSVLRIHEPVLTTKLVEELGALPALSNLSLYETNVDVAVAKTLREQAIPILKFQDVNFEADAFEVFVTKARLQQLALIDLELSPEQLSALRGSYGINDLFLMNVALTEEHLQVLGQLRHFPEMTLPAQGISRTRQEEFRKQLPRTNVTFY